MTSPLTPTPPLSASGPLAADTKWPRFLRSIRPACGMTAIVALAFSAAVTAGLLRDMRLNPSDPQADPAFLSLKARLVSDPANGKLKEEIRAADLRLRQEFFLRRSMAHKGAYLLAGGAAILLISLGLLVASPPRPAKPTVPLSEEKAPRLLASLGRLGVLAMGLLLIGGAMGWALYGQGEAGLVRLSARAPDSQATRPAHPMPFSTTSLAQATPGTGPSAPVASGPAAWLASGSAPAPMQGDFPGLAEICRNWPRFRGPLGAGVYEGPAPTRWDGKSGAGILWKRKLSLGGYSSPIVWGARVVLTGADKNTRTVLCLDAADGHVLWERQVKTDESPTTAPGVSEEEPEAPQDANTEPEPKMTDSGYAAATPAGDGNCFCAIFANGDIACFDPGGQERWSKNVHLQENSYGFASSLDLVGGLVIVQIDQGGEEDGKSRLRALDEKTGAIVWEAKPPVGGAWTSPIVVPMGGRATVLNCGNPFLMAHDLVDGKEIWRAKVSGGDAAPSPIFAGGLAMAVNSNTQLSAIRPGGEGDVSETHVAWKSDEDVPDIASPVSDGRLVWTVTTMGMLTCHEVATGRKVGEKKLGVGFQASPSIAGGKLYLLTETGTMLILEASPEAREIARCELGERASASPAFAGGRIYIRGQKNLYCIGAEGAAGGAKGNGTTEP